MGQHISKTKPKIQRVHNKSNKRVKLEDEQVYDIPYPYTDQPVQINVVKQ